MLRMQPLRQLTSMNIPVYDTAVKRQQRHLIRNASKISSLNTIIIILRNPSLLL